MTAKGRLSWLEPSGLDIKTPFAQQAIRTLRLLMNATSRKQLRAVAIACGSTALLLVLIFAEILKWDPKLGIAAITSIALFVYGIFEIRSVLLQQRAAFVRDYISKFFTEELYSIYHSLIYTYSDTKYEEIKAAFKTEFGEGVPSKITKPVYDFTEPFQEGRTEGQRFFHPDTFQRSIEERNLDRLLGFFDAIGYYFAKGLIEIDDIVTTLGYYLAVIQDRDVIQDYIKSCESDWSKLPYEKQMGCKPPFRYLTRMLKKVREYNQHKLEQEDNRLKG